MAEPNRPNTLPGTPSTPGSGRGGFTLIELMIVVMVLGVLAAIAIPNYVRMVDRSRRSSCLSNQRNLATHGVLFVFDAGIVDAVVNCQQIYQGGYVPESLTDCPNATDGSNDDYLVTVEQTAITDVTCQIRGADHEWSP